MKKAIFISMLFLTFAGASYGQCTTQSGFVCISQETANKLLNVTEQLIAAKDLIAKLSTQAGQSDAVIASAQRVIADYAELDKVNGLIIVKFKSVIDLYEKTLSMYAALVEKLETQLNKPKSAWQKFVNILGKVAAVLAGIAIGRGIPL